MDTIQRTLVLVKHSDLRWREREEKNTNIVLVYLRLCALGGRRGDLFLVGIFVVVALGVGILATGTRKIGRTASISLAVVLRGRCQEMRKKN